MAKTAKGLMRKQRVYKCLKLRAGWFRAKGWEWDEGQFGRRVWHVLTSGKAAQS